MNTYALPTGTVIVREEVTDKPQLPDKVCIYARVSSSENRSNLDSQAKRLEEYAIAKGCMIHNNVKEAGSGVDDSRKKLLKLLNDNGYRTLIVEHKVRLTRFGFEYINNLESVGKKIEIVNEAMNDREDLMQDLVSIVTSVCASYYGLRRGKRKTEKIISR